MDFKEIGFEALSKTRLAEDGTQWRDLMDTVVIKLFG
jgi:hypothetical protein